MRVQKNKSEEVKKVKEEYIGDNGKIRELRLSRGLSQKKVGEEIGVTQQNMSRYENNIYTIPLDILIFLAKYYDVTVEYLLGISKKKRGYPTEKLEKEEKELIELYELLSFKNRRDVLNMMKELTKQDR